MAHIPKIIKIATAIGALTATSLCFAAAAENDAATNPHELALPYKALIASKSVVDLDIRKAAHKITSGTKDKRQQARQLYNFVAQRIRPITYSTGFTRGEPHDASTVLRNGFGDSRDRAVLFGALLKARRITSTPALVNAGDNYSLPTAASLAEPATRVITYLSDFNLFADVGNGNAAFGELAFSISGKPALLIESAQILQTPMQTGDVALNKFDGVITLDQLGNAVVTAINTTSGYEAINFRKAVAARDPSSIAPIQLAMLKLTGGIAYENDDLTTLQDGYTLRWQASFNRLIDLDKKSFIVPQLPVETDLKAYSIALHKRKDATANWVCEGNKKQVHLQIILPNGMKTAEMPKNVDVSADGIAYKATYSEKNGSLFIDRTVVRTQASHLCTPEQAKQWQPIADAIELDLQSPIVLQ